MIIDTEQLLTHKELAKLKGMSLNLLAHYLGKPGAPQAIVVLGKKGYLRDEAEAWVPTRDDMRGKKRGGQAGSGS